MQLTDADPQMIDTAAGPRVSLLGGGFGASATASLGDSALSELARTGETLLAGTAAAGSGFVTAVVTVGQRAASLPHAIYRGSWQAVGPSGGDIRALAPAGDEDVYAATAGGVYRSTDRGDTWAAVSNGLDRNAYAIAVDPAHPGNLIAGTTTGVYRTADAGATWQRTALTTATKLVAIAPGEPTALLAYAPPFLYRSTDAGATWTKRAYGNGGQISAITFDQNDPTHLALAVDAVSFSDDATLYVSNDRGDTWAAANAGLEGVLLRDVAIDFGHANTLYATGSNAIYKSVDNAATWKKLAYGVVNHPPERVVVDLDTVYVGSPYTGVVASTDGGATWTERYAGTTSPSNARLAGFAQRFGGAAELYLSVRGEGVLRSGDGGKTWLDANAQMAARSFTKVEAVRGRPGLGLAIADGSVWRTTTSGALWLRSTIALPALGRVQDVATQGVQPTIALLAVSGGVYRTTDFGATWAKVGLASLDVRAVMFDRDDPSRAYAGAAQGLYRSLDGGVTWAKVAEAQGSGVTALAPRSGTIYAINNGHLMRSKDAGLTWTAFAASLTAPTALAVDATATDGLYALSGKRVYRSADGGSTWTAVTPANLAIRAFAADPSRAQTVYLATETGLLRSLTHLDTLRAFDTGLAPGSVRSIAIDGDSLYLATEGSGLRRIGP